MKRKNGKVDIMIGCIGCTKNEYFQNNIQNEQWVGNIQRIGHGRIWRFYVMFLMARDCLANQGGGSMHLS